MMGWSTGAQAAERRDKTRRPQTADGCAGRRPQTVDASRRRQTVSRAAERRSVILLDWSGVDLNSNPLHPLNLRFGSRSSTALQYHHILFTKSWQNFGVEQLQRKIYLGGI